MNKKKETSLSDFLMNVDDLPKLEVKVGMGLEPLPRKELSILFTLINQVTDTLNSSSFLQSKDPEYQKLKWNLLNNLRVNGMELSVLYRLSSNKNTGPLKSYISTDGVN